MSEAEQRFGSPGPVFVSGFYYPRWVLDDGNSLEIYFSLDKTRLEKAVVVTPTGQVIQVVLPLR